MTDMLPVKLMKESIKSRKDLQFAIDQLEKSGDVRNKDFRVEKTKRGWNIFVPGPRSLSGTELAEMGYTVK